LAPSHEDRWRQGRVPYLELEIQASLGKVSTAMAEFERWARGATWLGLEVLATERGGAGDSDGLVEFRARYRQEGTVRFLQEDVHAPGARKHCTHFRVRQSTGDREQAAQRPRGEEK